MTRPSSPVTRVRTSLAWTHLRAPLIWLKNQTVGEHDTLIASYPRSGSTWFSFLIFEILTGKPAQFDLVDRDIRSVGKQFGSPALLPRDGRIVRTHERYSKKYRKAIYLVRDVRDVVVSEFFYARLINTWRGELEGFVEQFLQGKVNPFGSWARHVDSWTRAASEEANLRVLKYEDIRRDPKNALTEVLASMEIDVSHERVRSAIANNEIREMRRKEDENPRLGARTRGRDLRFVRKGSLGGWHDHLSRDQLHRIECQTGEIMLRLGYRPESVDLAG